MNWYKRRFDSNQQVLDFLGRLNKNGVKPEQIKLASMGSWIGYEVFYLHDKYID